MCMRVCVLYIFCVYVCMRVCLCECMCVRVCMYLRIFFVAPPSRSPYAGTHVLAPVGRAFKKMSRT